MSTTHSWPQVALLLFAATFVCVLHAVRTCRRDPRERSTLAWINAAILALLWALAVMTSTTLTTLSALTLVAAPLFALPLVFILLNAGALIVVPQARTRATVICGVSGLALAAGLALSAWAGITWVGWLPVALLGSLTAAWLSVQCLSYLLYAAWYRRHTRVGERAFIVVLGAALRGTAPSPLLADRVDLGLSLYSRLVEAGGSPLLIMSGGQGPDEHIAESHAMAAYAREHGFAGPATTLICEDRSTTTEENLQFTREILRAHQCEESAGVAVTTDFHALRAAMLGCRLGLRLDAVGAPAARHTWPAGILREFGAYVRDTRRWQLALWALAVLPLPAALAAQIWAA